MTAPTLQPVIVGAGPAGISAADLSAGYLAGHCEGIRAAYAHYRHSAASRRCGDGGDRLSFNPCSHLSVPLR